jgi:hypothetical protein
VKEPWEDPDAWMDEPIAPLVAVVTAITSLEDFPLDGSVKTLGWGIIEWCESYLLQPDGDEAGSPYIFTREQVNFILHFYSIDAEGRFINRRSVLRRAKGWGKSPFLGALALAELCGPVRFGGWDDDDEPIGLQHPKPWIVIAGVSETQTQNTFDAIRAMCEDSALVDDYGLDVGMTRLLTPNGKIVPITASSSSQEGARPSFAIMDETHHWTMSNGGYKLAAVVRRNLAKSRDGAARVVETTNAHEPGMDSVAEASYLAWRAMVEGRTTSTGLLYDTREAPADIDLADEAQVMAGLKAAYGDATWVDLERIKAEVYDPGTPPEEARRFYLNQIVAAADAWISPPEWMKNKRDDLAPLLHSEVGARKKGDMVTLGFDGSLTDDSTALVACRVDDGATFLLAIWEKPEGPKGQGWAVPKDQVRDAIDHAFATLEVVAFFSDVAYWETDVDAWRDAYGEQLLVKATTRHAIGWDMRGHQMETTRSVEALHRAITDGELPWRAHKLIAGIGHADVNAEEILTRHMLNARRRINRWGVYFGKETRESPRKVDAVAALVLARMARARVLADGGLKKHRRAPGRLVGF